MGLPKTSSPSCRGFALVRGRPQLIILDARQEGRRYRSRPPPRCSICGRRQCSACYAQTGRLVEARSELDVFIGERERELNERGEAPPRTRLDLALSRADRYRNPLDREHFLYGLRKAGLTA